MGHICEDCDRRISSFGEIVKNVTGKCLGCVSQMTSTAIFKCDSDNNIAGMEKQRKAHAKPYYLRVTQKAESLQIKKRAFSPGAFVFLLLISVVWNIFPIFFIIIGASDPAVRTYMFWGLIFMGIPGLFLIFFTLRILFNSTVITIKNGVMDIMEGPLGSPGGMVLKTADIEQLFVKKHESMETHKIDYSLFVKTKKGLRDFYRIKSLNEIKYIEQRIEDFLGITNSHMPREHD